jgi:hypothetical protein
MITCTYREFSDFEKNDYSTVIHQPFVHMKLNMHKFNCAILTEKYLHSFTFFRFIKTGGKRCMRGKRLGEYATG